VLGSTRRSLRDSRDKSTLAAPRLGDYKLVEWFEDGKLELYDLSADIGESRDLTEVRPELASELHEILVEWRRSVDARMPVPNPDWRPD
jgi:arylsulfatase A